MKATDGKGELGVRAWGAILLLNVVVLLPGHARAQDPLVGLRASGASFMYAGYSTDAASALYAARGFGPVSIVIGAVQNHKSGYRETTVGALSSISYQTQSVTVAVACTDATDAPYVQIYALPALHAGAVSLAATGLFYQPLDGAGTRQLELNPVMLLAWFRPWLAFGGTYSLSVAADSAANQREGMAVRLRLRATTITLELLHGTERGNEELRISFWAGY